MATVSPRIPDAVDPSDETFLILLDNHIQTYPCLKKSGVRMLEPRTRMLDFIGIICSKFLSTTFQVHVIDENTARIGPPAAMSLQEYLRKYKFSGAKPTLSTDRKPVTIGANRTLLVH